jgi:hypothetical protein
MNETDPIDPELGVRVEGDFAFGPFDQPMIDDCVARGGGDTCQTLRWERSLVAPLPAKTQKLMIPMTTSEACHPKRARPPRPAAD